MFQRHRKCYIHVCIMQKKKKKKKKKKKREALFRISMALLSFLMTPTLPHTNAVGKAGIVLFSHQRNRAD